MRRHRGVPAEFALAVILAGFCYRWIRRLPFEGLNIWRPAPATGPRR